MKSQKIKIEHQERKTKTVKLSAKENVNYVLVFGGLQDKLIPIINEAIRKNLEIQTDDPMRKEDERAFIAIENNEPQIILVTKCEK